MAYLQEKKKSLCLPRNYHIFQHFRNHQSVLEASLMEPGIGGKISKGACAFSVTYWYSFHVSISNILLDTSDAAKIYATLPPGTSLSLVTVIFTQSEKWIPASTKFGDINS